MVRRLRQAAAVTLWAAALALLLAGLALEGAANALCWLGEHLEPRA